MKEKRTRHLAFFDVHENIYSLRFLFFLFQSNEKPNMTEIKKCFQKKTEKHISRTPTRVVVPLQEDGPLSSFRFQKRKTISIGVPKSNNNIFAEFARLFDDDVINTQKCQRMVTTS